MAAPKKKKQQSQTQTIASKELVKNQRDRFAIQKSTGELAMDDRRLLTLAQGGGQPRRDVRGARPAG